MKPQQAAYHGSPMKWECSQRTKQQRHFPPVWITNSLIFQLESRPGGNGDQCISAFMKGNESLHPPIQSDRQMFIQNKNITVGNCSHDSTGLTSSTMVFFSFRDANAKTNSSTNFSKSVLTSPTGSPFPLTSSKSLHLAAWKISGNT